MMRGKSVMVLGIGNSATDLAVEASRNAERTFLAMRRGAWIVPKYVGSKPTDELAPALLSRLPLAVQRFLLGRTVKKAAGVPTDYGLPEPDHKLAEAHPTVSSDLLPRLGTRRHRGQAEHRALCRRSHGRVRGRHLRGDRPDRLLHGLQDHVPVLRRTISWTRRTTASRSTAGSSIPSSTASTSWAWCSRWGRSCRSPRRSPNGSPTSSRARRRCRRRSACER